LRVKESDRLSAIELEINKLSPGTIEVDGDTLIIHGGKVKRMNTCKTYGDHRMAMSLGIMGMAASGVELDDIDCVNISYPNFFDN
jgi:3-phosphoshikimate 1-carboxyvinyltransferase